MHVCHEKTKNNCIPLFYSMNDIKKRQKLITSSNTKFISMYNLTKHLFKFPTYICIQLLYFSSKIQSTVTSTHQTLPFSCSLLWTSLRRMIYRQERMTPAFSLPVCFQPWNSASSSWVSLASSFPTSSDASPLVPKVWSTCYLNKVISA